MKHLHGPKLGSDDWYMAQIVESYHDPRQKGNERWDIGFYKLRTLLGYMGADFDSWLGEFAPFASNEKSDGLPLRLHYQPHWLGLYWSVVSYDTFKLYQWLHNCKHQGITNLPINDKTRNVRIITTPRGIIVNTCMDLYAYLTYWFMVYFCCRCFIWN